MPNNNKRGYTNIQTVGKQVLIMLENGKPTVTFFSSNRWKEVSPSPLNS